MRVFIIREGCDSVESFFLANAVDTNRFKSGGFRRIDPESAEMFFLISGVQMSVK